MPEQLSQALQRAAGGFDSKLQAVMGTFQNLQRAQFAKQQMARELENRKELAQFQSDLDFERRKRIHEEIELPAMQAQQQQQMLQQLQESFTQAEDSRVEDKRSFTDNRFYRDYGLLRDIDFAVTQEDSTGMYKSVPVLFSDDGTYNQIDNGTLIELQRKAEFVSSKFAEWEGMRDNLADGEDLITTEGQLNVTRDTLPQIIRNAQQDPRNIEEIWQQLQSRNENVQVAEEVVQDDSARFISQNLNFKDQLGGRSDLQLDFAVQGTWGVRTPAPWKTEVKSLSLNMNKPVGRNLSEIDSFLSETMGIDIDTLKRHPEAMQLAVEGRASEIDDRNIRKLAERFQDIAENNSDNARMLLHYYINVPQMLDEWNNRYARQPLSPSQVVYNPFDDFTDRDLSNAFRPVDMSVQQLHNELLLGL